MRTTYALRKEAARLAVASTEPGTDMAQVFARALWFERYLKSGADKTQAVFKTLPEDSATLHVIKGGKQ